VNRRYSIHLKTKSEPPRTEGLRGIFPGRTCGLRGFYPGRSEARRRNPPPGPKVWGGFSPTGAKLDGGHPPGPKVCGGGLRPPAGDPPGLKLSGKGWGGIPPSHGKTQGLPRWVKLCSGVGTFGLSPWRPAVLWSLVFI